MTRLALHLALLAVCAALAGAFAVLAYSSEPACTGGASSIGPAEILADGTVRGDLEPETSGCA